MWRKLSFSAKKVIDEGRLQNSIDDAAPNVHFSMNIFEVDDDEGIA